jgi:hypothetical protein
MSPLLELAKGTVPATRDASRSHRRRHRGSCFISTEIELKLAAPSSDLQKLKCLLLAMPTVRSEVKSGLTSTYYDTSDLASLLSG